MIAGEPDPKHISTSYVERQNLTMRMHGDRESLAYDRLYAVFYIVKMHKTLRTTPTMAAGVVDQLRTVENVVGLVDEWEAKIPRTKVGRKPKSVAKS